MKAEAGGGLDTLADVAIGLSAAINADRGEEFLALAVGEELVLINRDGASFSMANGVEFVPSTRTTLVDLTDSSVEGEVWTLILDDGERTSTHAHVVAAGEPQIE